MPEEIVWRGNSSQWKNAGRYLLCLILGAIVIAVFFFASNAATSELSRFTPFILLFLVAPIFMALTRYLQTKSRTFELTTERLKTSHGVLNKVTETLELYRVKDLALSGGIGILPMISQFHRLKADATSKGVREIDVE